MSPKPLVPAPTLERPRPRAKTPDGKLHTNWGRPHRGVIPAHTHAATIPNPALDPAREAAKRLVSTSPGGRLKVVSLPPAPPGGLVH
jgi:hypothetical protein